ncbi:hypothetical protein N7488_001836 [Penicillium malachiteum]|nr:hypothetical protein N7488_001836 [Penicillium malachiteum]
MDENLDEAIIHRLEAELHTKLYPGTELMTDVGSHHFVKGGSQVLVPQPSADPHDPLNWSRSWKTFTMVISTAVTFTQNLGPLSLAPTFGEMIVAFDFNLADVIQFTGVCILV